MMFEREKMRIRKRRRNNAIIILGSLVAIAIFWSTGEHNRLGFSKLRWMSDKGAEVKGTKNTDFKEMQMNTFDPSSIIDHFQKTNQPINKRKVVVQDWKTSQGSRVLFMPTSDLPIIDIRVIFDAGSARDNDSIGASSFVASLLGKGSEQFSEDEIVKGFEAVGAQFSASAYRDMGVVHLRSLSAPAYFEPSVDLLLEVLTRPTFPMKEMERLRALTITALIKNKELASVQANELFMKAIYKDHPYGRVTTIEDVKVLRLNDILSFYNTYYTAQNASIAIVGDLSRAEAENFVEKLVSMLPSGEKLAPLPDPPVLDKSIVINHPFPSTQAHVRVGRWMMDRNDPDFEAMYMANQILGGSGFSSILAEEVRVKRGLAYSVSSSFSGMNSKGPFSISFQTKVDDHQEAVDISQQVLVEMAKNGVDQARFDRVKKYVVGSFPLSTSSNRSIVSYLGLMAFYDLPADYLDRFVEKLVTLDIQSVNDIAAKYWRDKPMATVIVGNTETVPVETDVDSPKDEL